MDLTCPTCGTTTVVPDDRLPPEGTRARCHECSEFSVYYRGGLVADDPTPPQGLTSGSAHEMPMAAPAVRPLSSVPTIALASPVPSEAPPPPPPPALAGPPKSIGWQIRTAAGDQGPLPIDSLKPMIRDGRLGPDDLACPPGDEKWTRAGDLPDLQRWFALQKKAGGPAAAKPSDMAPCSRHPGVRGRWMCQGCGNLACDQCVVTAEVMRVQVRQCPLCRKACTELVPSKKITPFWEEIPMLLSYPFKGMGWLALIIFPIMGACAELSRAAAMAMAAAWGAAAIFTLSIYSYHLYVIRVTTKGSRSMPNLGKVDDYQEELFKPAGKAAFVSFLLFVPTIFATSWVRDAKLMVGVAEGLHASVVEEKKQAEERAKDPEAYDRAQAAAGEDTVEGALASAFGSLSEDSTPEDFGNVMGQVFGSLDQREERDWDAELREAQAALDEAKGNLFRKQLVRGILAVVALGIWPIFLIIVALFNTIMPVFQPHVLFKLIQEIPREYAWCTLFTSACFLCIYLLNVPMRGVTVFHNWLTSPLTYYFSLIAFHVMGRTAEMAEQKVDWH